VTSAAGRILGNLDCEADFATLRRPGRARPGRPRPGRVRPGRARPTLSRAALETASALATLLRAFARDGDTLWTPAPVARRRLAEVPGLPRPALETGPLPALAAPRQVLAWGETPAAAEHRRRAYRQRASQPAAAELPPEAPLHEDLWRLPVPEPAVAARVHHRAFALEVASDLGIALPGARMVASPAELEEHLRSGAAEAAGGTGRWVLKAPLSAAGRWRHFGRGPAANPRRAGGDTRRIERLFARHGPLLFEPWLDRGEDFGVAGLLDGRGARLVGFHRSLVGRRGAFLGVELDAVFRGLRGLDDGERRRLEEVFDGVARALRREGYSGPFGIDCWRYRRRDGAPGRRGLAWHPLGEINARMTFGLVARALVDRLRGPLGLDPRAAVRLRVGAGPGPRTPPAVPLLLPSAGGLTAAWLEIPA
jgi:hypothetical protein